MDSRWLCVDSIIVAGTREAFEDFHKALVKNYPISNVGELKLYTGCALERDWELGTLEITQTTYFY